MKQNIGSVSMWSGRKVKLRQRSQGKRKPSPLWTGGLWSWSDYANSFLRLIFKVEEERSSEKSYLHRIRLLENYHKQHSTDHQLAYPVATYSSLHRLNSTSLPRMEELSPFLFIPLNHFQGMKSRSHQRQQQSSLVSHIAWNNKNPSIYLSGSAFPISSLQSCPSFHFLDLHQTPLNTTTKSHSISFV